MLTLEQIQPYLQYRDVSSIPQKLRHEFYDESIQYKAEIDKIFSKKYPDYLKNVRPRERKSDAEYREKIYKNKWTHLPDRISEALDYIHQADDFGISFPQAPDGLDEERTLKYYTSDRFTADGDLKEWFFNNCIDPYLRDPNCCAAMVLNDLPSNDPEYTVTGLLKPTPVLFASENVIAHQKGRFAVLVSPEKRRYRDLFTGEWREGNVIHFFDDESYTAAFEVGVQDNINSINNDYNKIINYQIVGVKREIFLSEDGSSSESITFEPILHHFDSMPVYKMGKRRSKFNSKREELYKSHLDGALAGIKESQQIQLDIELERTFHVTSAEWRRASAFPKCKNPQCIKGVVPVRETNGNNLVNTQCPSCKGTGLEPSSGSSLEMLIVNDSVDSSNIGVQGQTRPSTNGAPGGYIERSIAPIVELTKQKEEADNDVYRIINMQFIRTTPNEASGASKRYDREELYRELNTQAAHLLPLLKKLYAMADNERYTQFSYVGEQTPDVLIPVRFNLENAELTRDELNDAKDKEYDPALVSALEMKLLEYNVGTNAAEYKQYETRLKLDPYRTSNNDERNMIIGLFLLIMERGTHQDNAIRELVFSIMIDSLMIRAELEFDDFYMLPLKRRKEIMYKYLDDDYFSGIKDFPVPDIDPTTGLPKMAQFAVRPSVNIQDTTQTSKGNKQKSMFDK